MVPQIVILQDLLLMGEYSFISVRNSNHGEFYSMNAGMEVRPMVEVVVMVVTSVMNKVLISGYISYTRWFYTLYGKGSTDVHINDLIHNLYKDTEINQSNLTKLGGSQSGGWFFNSSRISSDGSKILVYTGDGLDLTMMDISGSEVI